MITPRRVATLCIGVSAYPPHALASDERPLRFAAASAKEFHTILCEQWPDDSSCHCLRIDDAATWAGVRSAIEELRSAGGFDLLLVFLAGHGRRTADGFSLLLWPDSATEATVAAAELESALAEVNATASLVFLDACHAGAFLDASPVRARGTAAIAMVVASARSDQRSWEDPLVARTLFADAIICGLTAAGQPGRASVDVLAELVPFVAEHVTRHAYGLKAGAIQEPIWATVASASLQLPRSLLRSRVALTTRQVLIRRTRQILTAVAAAAAVLLLATSIMTWRPALNSSGFVELRAGPKWLSPMNVGPWAHRLETSIQRSELIAPDVDPTVIAGILDERGVYPWFGRNVHGLQRWIDHAQSWLTEEVALRWRVRLDDPGLPAALLTTARLGIQTVTTPRATRLEAERALLHGDGVVSEAWTRQWREHDFGLPCRDSALSADIGERAELLVETTTPEHHATWIRDLALAARASKVVTFAQVHRLIENFHAIHVYSEARYRATLGGAGESLTANRIARAYDVRPTRLERDALADLSEAVAVRELGGATFPSPAEVRRVFEVDAASCADWGIPAVARLGTRGTPAAVSMWAHSRSSSDQGRGALGDLARAGALAASDVTWILGLYGFGRTYSETMVAVGSTSEWLAMVAEQQPLEPAIATQLLEFARAAIARGEAEAAMDALKPVAWSVGRLPSPTQVAFRTTLQSLRNHQPLALLTDREIELWGIAGARGVNDADVARTLVDLAADREAAPRVVFDQGDAGNGVRRLAAGWKLENVTALARISSGVSLLPRDRDAILEFLERTATDGLRAGVPSTRLRPLFDSIATLRGRIERDVFSAPLVVEALRASARDAAGRAAVVEVARAHLRTSPAKANAAALGVYRTLWREEHEPEVKYALAALILGAEEDRRIGPVAFS